MFAHAKKRNIFLTGMMGTGKSSIGEIVARKLAYMFIDTDAIIERRHSLPISEIFATLGENYFRDNEAALLSGVISRELQVVATGGGMLANAENLKLARENGMVILLRAPVDILAGRLANTTDRPLLEGSVPEERLQEIYKERAAIYESIGCSVDTGTDSLETAADKVIELYMTWLSE